MLRALFILCIVPPVMALGQDSLRASTKVRAGFKPLLQIDTRYTFINGRSVQFYGLRLGAQKGKDILAVGFYGVGDPLRRDSVLLEGIGRKNTIAQLDYTGLTYQHLFIDSRYWQISLPVLVGLGSATTRYVVDDRTTVLWSKNEVVTVEPMAKVSFKFFSWLYLDTGAGYRLLLSRDPRIQRTYSAWTYDLGLVVRFGQLYRSAREGLKRMRSE